MLLTKRRRVIPAPDPLCPIYQLWPLITWACYVPLSRPNVSCLCLPPFTNEPSDRRLYLPTATSPTRAASPPSTTKTCTTTRISGTCKSFTAHYTVDSHAQSFCVILLNISGPERQAARMKKQTVSLHFICFITVQFTRSIECLY